MNVTFNYYHIRAKKARLCRKMLKKPMQVMLFVIIGASVAAGLLFAVTLGQSAAVFFVPAVLTGMFLLWLNSDDMKNSPTQLPPVGTQSMELHKVLDRRVLGKLKQSHTPMDIWKAVRGTWRQRFFTIRYGISPQAFDEYLSTKPEDSAKVWEHALELAHHEGQNSITAATLTVALLTTIPGYETYLAQLHLEPIDLVVGIDWQRHVELLGERARQKSNFGGIARDWAAGYTPLLNQLGHNISYEIQYQGGLLNRQIDAHQEITNQMLAVLGQRSRANITLVGNVGVGKTTLAYSFAQRLLMDKTVPPSLRYNHVVTLQASTILAQAINGVTVENIVLHLIAEARAAKNIILFFDEAQFFFQQNANSGSVDLRNVLLPILESGTVPLIFAMSPHDWQTLSTGNAALASLMNFQAVPEPDEQNTMRVLEDQVLFTEYKHHVIFTYQALNEAYRLAARYIHDIAFPGRAIRVLEGAVTHAQNHLVTEQSIQKSLEVTLGVKVQTADPQEKQKLLNLEDEIHRRMINQKRAVNVVADALRRARSGVNNPNKPIGTFLFLGPTGVGKTELSKALAEVYFSGADRIVRVDMNEYVRSEDVARLLTPAGETATGLLPSIRRQPFTVVLFDEIEKAHPDVVNVFLQLLDEGVMRDAQNREYSFRDAIIIATSNAGADRLRQYIEAGYKLEDFEEQFTNELINSNQFKPEFLNRFDEIVLFRPLTKEELLQVVDLMIGTVNKTLARQKVQVQLTDAAKRWLVEHGYDARLGARPLRRMVQRSVENIVAKKLLQDTFAPGSLLTLDEPDLEAILAE